MRFGFLCSFCCEVSFIQPNEFICLSRVSFFAATALSWVLIYAVFVFDLGNILVIWSKPLKILGRLREIFRSRVFGFDDRIQFWFEMGLWILIWHIRFFSSLICSFHVLLSGWRYRRFVSMKSMFFYFVHDVYVTSCNGMKFICFGFFSFSFSSLQ